MRHLPPLAAVRVFESAARHENFTAAAAELGMTQAAVSYQIQVLEERLGVSLFTRAKRRVTLSEAGRRVAPAVSKAFDTMANGFSELLDQSRSVLAISTAQTFAATWLASRLGRFQFAHPEFAASLSTSDRFVDFASDPVDVAIRVGVGPWPGLAWHFLFHSHVTPMCSPRFRDRNGLDTPERLLDVQRISPDDGWWPLWLAQAGLEANADLQRPGIGLESQVMEAAAAMADHGIALMTPLFWKAELSTGRLVQPFEQLLLPGASYWLVYPEPNRHQPKIRAFRDWLLGEVEANAADGPASVFAE